MVDQSLIQDHEHSEVLQASSKLNNDCMEDNKEYMKVSSKEKFLLVMIPHL